MFPGFEGIALALTMGVLLLLYRLALKPPKSS